MAEGKGQGLTLAREIYARALEHMDELCAPYAAVVDIDRSQLPSSQTVKAWSSEQFVGTLRHDQSNQAYNPHLRQLLHIAYKIAASLGERYFEALRACENTVSKNVTENLYQRH